MEARSSSTDAAPAPAGEHPIVRRLGVLEEQWRAFAALPDARLLRWVVRRDELRLCDAFFHLANDARAGDEPEIFLRFDEPFEDATRHGFALREGLIQQVEAARPGCEAEGVAVDWACPALDPGKADTAAFARACGSFCAHHEGALDRLVVVLAPDQIGDGEAWQIWLQRMMHAAAALPVRFIALDPHEAPALDALAKGEPMRVQTMSPDLDMPSAYEEVSAAAGRLDTPGGRFRHAFVRLGRALGEGDIPAAEAHAREALTVTDQEGWHALSAGVHLAVGGGLLGARRAPEAVARYRKAEGAAVEAEKSGDPSGTKLRVQARFATAGGLMAEGAFDQAGVIYETTAPLAQDLDDKLLLLECRRMASFAYEQAGLPDRAWTEGVAALAVGGAMSSAERAGSTLPYAGQGLLRLARHGACGADADAVEAKVAALLGPGSPKAGAAKTSAAGVGEHVLGYLGRRGLHELGTAGSASGGSAVMLASKHFDLVLGVDIHKILLYPPVSTEVPIPHPFIGMLFDPMDYIPFLGSTVDVYGLPRTQAGSSVLAIPHIPIGGTFVKKPDDEGEVFMGSLSVVADGDAFSYLALPVLTCSDIGMPPIPRPKKKKAKSGSMVLPLSVIITIPMGKLVLVGGAPTVSAMALGMRVGMAALGAALKKLSKTKAAKKLKGKVDDLKAKGKEKLKRKTPSTNKGCGRPGEPVDVVTGANVDVFDDHEVGGEVPIRWRRYYSSLLCGEDGPMGRGFRHEYQRELRRNAEGRLEYVDGEGEPVEFPALGPDVLEAAHDGYRIRALSRDVYEVRHGDERMEFALARGARCAGVRRLWRGEAFVDFEYRDDGGLLAIWEPSGRRVRLFHDAQGHVVRVALREDGDETTFAAYDYDDLGRLTRWRDAAGNAATYDYDAGHRMTRKGDRRGYSFLYRYDDAGRCVESTGEDGLYAIQLEYGAGATVVTWGDGGRWVYRYNEEGTITEIVDPYGGKREFRLDEDGRVVEDVDPNGNVTQLLYDQDGGHHTRVDPLGYELPPVHVDPTPHNPLAYTLPATPLEWELGGLLDPRRIRRPFKIEGLERWTFDAEGNATSCVDQDGRERRWEYGSWKLVKREIDGCGGVTAFEYSATREVTKVVGPTGTVIEYAYDQKDRISEVRMRGRVFDRYFYDGADNLIEKQDGQGRTLLSLEIGRGNQFVVRRLGSGEVQRFEYDERGRITAASTDRLRVTFKYDEQGRMTEDLRDGLGVRHVFDEEGIRETVYFDRFQVRYRREAGRVIITDPTGGEHEVRVHEGGRVERRLSSGVSEIAEHDAEGRCLRRERRRAGEDRAWTRDYRYSAAGDLVEVEDSKAGVTRYEYDAAHRLQAWVRPAGERHKYLFDAAGNLIEQPGLRGAQMGDGNLLVSAEGQRFTYDDRDRLVRWERGARMTTFAYDAHDRLVHCEIDGEPWEAAYDPLCRRVAKTFRKETTRYFWDDFRLAAEQRGGGALRLYVYADHLALVPFLWVEYGSLADATEAGRVYLVTTDPLGVPVHVEDVAGAVAWEGEVDPFGVVRVAHGGGVSLRFPGHYHDPETGLHYNRFRYYSPELGRYVSADPLGVAGGINLYAYPGNPVEKVDVDGLMASKGQACPTSAPTETANPKPQKPRFTLSRTPPPSKSGPNAQQPQRLTVDKGPQTVTHEAPQPQPAPSTSVTDAIAADKKRPADCSPAGEKPSQRRKRQQQEIWAKTANAKKEFAKQEKEVPKEISVDKVKWHWRQNALEVKSSALKHLIDRGDGTASITHSEMLSIVRESNTRNWRFWPEGNGYQAELRYAEHLKILIGIDQNWSRGTIFHVGPGG